MDGSADGTCKLKSGVEKESLREDLGNMKTPWSDGCVCSQGVDNTEMMWQHPERQSLLKELVLAWPARRACLIWKSILQGIKSSRKSCTGFA